MWICWLSSGIVLSPSFSTLPSLQLLVTFHLPGHGAAGNNQKLRASTRLRHFPKSKLVIHTNRNSTSLSTWIFRWFLRIIFFHGQKSKITLIGWAIFSSTHSKTVLSVIGKTKPTKPKQVKPSQTFGYTSVFLSGIAGASSTWREHLSASATGSEKWMIMMFSLKHAWTLGPGIYPENQNTEQARRTRKPCKTGYLGGLQGDPPLWMQKLFKNNNFK